MIPKTLHVVWVGDSRKCPLNFINTWRKHNPSWRLRLWTDTDLAERTWQTRRHIDAMYKKQLCGVADMMRYEILHAEGGFAIDADSACLRPLEDWLFEEGSVFACWANEKRRPGLIANGFMAAKARDPFVKKLVDSVAASSTVTNGRASKTVGPKRLTELYNNEKYPGFKIWPSHYFLPEFHSGEKYKGSGPVFASHRWGSTKNLYASLSREKVPR